VGVKLWAGMYPSGTALDYHMQGPGSNPLCECTGETVCIYVFVHFHDYKQTLELFIFQKLFSAPFYCQLD
jgi:hypothetical protein